MKKIIVVRPELGDFDVLKVEEITLKLLQEQVGGYIQTCAPVEIREKGFEMLCDEEGLLKGRTPNANLFPFFYVGNVVFVKVSDDDFTGLDFQDIAFVFQWIRLLKKEL